MVTTPVTTEVWTSSTPLRFLSALSTSAASSAQHIPSILSWLFSWLPLTIGVPFIVHTLVYEVPNVGGDAAVSVKGSVYRRFYACDAIIEPCVRHLQRSRPPKALLPTLV